MIKKIKRIQIFRHIIQLIMFILSPGLFILAFSEFKSIYTMIIKGNLNFIAAFPTLIEFITAIIITIVLGRFFCGWVCAFGAYNDLLHSISKNVFRIDFKINKSVDAALKYVKYLVLLLLAVVVWTMGSKVLDTSSPWDAFAQITNFPQVLADYTIGSILLILITAGALFVERFFCRYLCPLGAVFNIFSRIGILKIKKPTDKCGKCRVCTNNCSMGLALYKVESVCGSDCINCFKCIESCPRKNTKVNVLGENINPELASTVAIAAMVGIYAANTLGAAAITKSGLTATNNNITTISAKISSTSQKYKDGTYTGTGTGFQGGTTQMSVTIKNDKITNIQTISNGDTLDFYQRAESAITSEIISSQSTSVDTVSGATYSSEGIIGAVQDALKKAQASSSASVTSPSATNVSKAVASSKKSKVSTSSGTSSSRKNMASTSNDTSSSRKSTVSTSNGTSSSKKSAAGTSNKVASTSSSSASSTTSKQSTYKDGTYTGTGSGFRGGTTQMSVTIKNNKIASVVTASNQDSPDFYQRAVSTITSEIVSAQSTSVDTVSGATYSSEGIIGAVKDALSQAKA